MALLGTVGETGSIGGGSTASTPTESNPITPGGQVNTPATSSTPATGGSPQIRDPGTVGSSPDPSIPSSSDSSGSSDGALTVPPLGSLTPQATPVSTFSSTPAAPAPTASASDVGLLTQAQASDAAPLAGINNGQIDPNDATNSASQLDAITSQNSPYIQLAEQQGLLSAASRGLENSSIAAGSAQAAATAAAAPLAQQNASEASQGILQNSQLETQANEFNSSQDTAAKELAAQLGTSVSQSNAQLETSNNEFNSQQTQAAAAANAAATNSMAAQTAALTEDMNKQDLSGTQAQKLADIQAESNNLIATNQAASSMYSSYLSSMSATMANQNISPERAADTITAMQSMLQSGLSVMDQLNGMSLDIAQPSTTGNGSGFVTAPAQAPQVVGTSPAAKTGAPNTTGSLPVNFGP